MGVDIADRNKPPYRVVYEHFRNRAEGAGEGVLIPSRVELAKQFSVGEATVSRAIDLLKKNGFAYGQQGRGTYICAHRQKSAKIKQVAFLSPCFQLDIVRYSRGFERIFKEDGDYSVSLHSAQMNVRKYKSTVEHIADNGLSGVILGNLSSLGGIRDSIDMRGLVEAGIPVVVIGGRWSGLHCDSVEHTRRDSAKRMADHAARQGCQTPGVFLQLQGDDEDNEEFLDELNHAFGHHNIEIKRENIFYYDFRSTWTDTPDSSIDPYIDAYRFVKKEFARVSQCDSLMFHGDGGAIGALRALREGGIEVPGQIKLLSGFQGTAPESQRENLTTVNTNIEEQARMAAKLLKKRMEGYDGPVEAHYIAGELIEGGTT